MLWLIKTWFYFWRKELKWQALHVLPLSQNKYNFRSWAWELRRGKKVESAHETRRGRGGDIVVLESENYTYFGTNLESWNYTCFGTEGVLSRRTARDVGLEELATRAPRQLTLGSREPAFRCGRRNYPGCFGQPSCRWRSRPLRDSDSMLRWNWHHTGIQHQHQLLVDGGDARSTCHRYDTARVSPPHVRWLKCSERNVTFVVSLVF